MFKRKKKSDSQSLQETINRLQKEIERKGLVEKAMVDIAPLFRSSERIDLGVNTALKYLVKISQSTRAFVLLMKDQKTLHMKYEYCNNFVVPVKKFLHDFPYKEYGWFRDQNIDKGYINVPDVSKMPPEANEVKEVFDKIKAKAMLAVSFGSRCKFGGTLAVVNKKALNAWDEEVIQFILFIASMLENVYERKHAEDSLKETLKQAQASDNLKTAIINNISHEIRTPLNSITGFSHLIANRELSHDRRVELSNVIEQNSDRLLSVMGDLLDISQLDSETLELKKEKFNFKSFITAIYYNHKIIFDKKVALRFDLDFDDTISIVDFCNDADRLKQIIDNLLKNAYKFTETGNVLFYCKELHDNIVIGVSDTGIGIQEIYFNKVFERFWQANMSLTRAHGGSGLGLSIAKALAEKLRFSISFSSVFGEGSDFQVVIPKKEVQCAENIRDLCDSKSPVKRVLVADDFIPIHEYINTVCSDLGVECVCVTDGQEAIDLYSSEHFDLVLLDLVMPMVNGTEALRKIKSINPKAVVLGQTAYDINADIAKYLKLGFADFLIKPYKPKDLMGKISHFIVNS